MVETNLFYLVQNTIDGSMEKGEFDSGVEGWIRLLGFGILKGSVF